LISGAPLTYSDVQGGTGGVGNVNMDPRFVRNPSPGADLTWGTADDDAGDLRIAASSPIVDCGDNSAITSTTDLSGASRFQDVPTSADAGAGIAPIVDLGAYEAAPVLSADAGGPYALLQGTSTFTLSGHGASKVPGALQFDWDLNGDGAFDDAAGATPVVNTAVWSAGTVLELRLRITDDSGHSTVSTTSLQIAPRIAMVDSRATTGAANGTAWADAFTTLQAALAASLPGQSIRVAGGTYKPTTAAVRRVALRPSERRPRYMEDMRAWGRCPPTLATSWPMRPHSPATSVSPATAATTATRSSYPHWELTPPPCWTVFSSLAGTPTGRLHLTTAAAA
jgi:hypothetical protein